MIDWNNFTPYTSLAGGIIIGISASMLLFFNGRICGISGIAGQLLSPTKSDVAWRVFFLLGLLSGGFVLLNVYEPSINFALDLPVITTITAGLLVGFGTRLGSGCTSGHGVCGISRFSLRSIIATIIFMLFGILTAYFTLHYLGS